MAALRVAFQLGSRLDGGMARYAQELARALAAHADVDLVPIGTGPVLDAMHDELGRPGDQIVVPGGQLAEATTMRFRLGRMLRGRADVLHGTKHLLPRRSPVPTVLTVHDVLPLDEPHAYTLAKRLLLPRQYRASIRAASALAVVSQTTADRLAKLMPAVMAKAVVVRTVAAPVVMSAAPIAPPAPPETFGLYVGDLSPRKNVGFLLDLWEEVHRQSGRPLVLAGPDGWKAEPILSRLPGLEARGVVRRMGFVDNGTLRWLYEHASVVVLPSRYEGTGLPVVEALALGAPVIASDEPALVEHGGGQALHLPLHDRHRWLDALADALASPRPPARPSAVATAIGDPAAWADAHVAMYKTVISDARRGEG